MKQRVYVKDREGTSYVTLMTEKDVTMYHFLVKQLTAQGVMTSFDEMVLYYFPAVQKVPVDDVPEAEGRQ